MGESQQVQRVRSYFGGVNSRLFPLDIQDDEAVELQNIDTSKPGLTQKRKGSTLTATGITLGPIVGLGSLSPAGNPVLLAVSPNVTDGSEQHYRLWKWDGTTTQWSLVGVLTGFTASVTDISITQHYDLTGAYGGFTLRHVAIISGNNGSNVDRYGYDGVQLKTLSFAVGTPHPSTAAIESAYYRLFGAGGGNAKNRVFFSDVGSGTATGWGGGSTQAWTLGGSSAGGVVAVKQYRPNLLICFLEDKTETLIIADALTDAETARNPFGSYTGGNLWSREVIDPQIGCGARRTVQTTGEDIFFLDQFGNVRSIAQTISDSRSGSRSLPVSDKIQSYIDRINAGYISTASAIAYDRFYYLALPLDSATTPSHVFRFDTTRRAWDGPWTGLDPAVFTVAVLSASGASAADKNPTIYLGTNRVAYGEVLRLERGSDDSGTSIEYKETTKRYSFNSLELKKRWMRLEVFAIGTADENLTVEANPGGKGWVSIGTMNLLGDAPQLPIDLTFTLGGFGISKEIFSLENLSPTEDIQLRFSITSANTVQILGFSIMAFIEKFESEVTEP